MLINAILDQAMKSGGKNAAMAGFPVSSIAQAALVLACLLTPLFCWYVREEGDAWIVNAFVSTIAFPFWAYLTGAVAFANYHDGNLAAILVMTFTVVSGLVAPLPSRSCASRPAEARPRRRGRVSSRPAGKADRPRGPRDRDCERPNSSCLVPPDGGARNHSGVRFWARRPYGLSRDRGRTAGRRFPLCRRRCRFSLWRDGRSGPRRPRHRPDRRPDRTHRPDLIVIACNTASTIALPELRESFRCRSSAPCRRSSPLAPAR